MIMTLGLVVTLLITGSCEEFLTRNNLTAFTDENFWISESNVRAFSWRLYGEFGGFSGSEFLFHGNLRMTSDLLEPEFTMLLTTPSTGGGDWSSSYTNIRSTNLLLERLDQVEMTPEKKDHFTGVAKFFRSLNYFNLVRGYGDAVLRLTYEAPDIPDEEMFIGRTDRKVIVDLIIADLTEAQQKLLDTDLEGAITKDVATALLARVALFEGTFRKYHSLGDYQGYLTTAANAAGTLVSSTKYSLQPSFRTKFSADNLAGNPEVIFYKRHEPTSQAHSTQAYMTCSAPPVPSPNKFTVERYLCTDGLPISQSPLYQGDHGLDNVLANRDKRLLESIWTDQLSYNGYEYKDYVFKSTTGYTFNLFLRPENEKSPGEQDIMAVGRNHTDAPLYTLPEMYLIYAEAKAELGTLTQTDLDNTVNKLRARAGVAALQVSGSDAFVGGVQVNDPARTAELESITKGGIVSPIIWEIRRERMAEFIGWLLLRHMDIDRWAKGEYIDTNLNPDAAKGAWLGTAPNDLVNVGADGYIRHHPMTNQRVWQEKHYLENIPTNEINSYPEALRPLLKQNPGW